MLDRVRVSAWLMVSAVFQYPPKFLLIAVIVPLMLLGGQLPIFIYKVSPFIVPALNAVTSGNVEQIPLPLFLLSYAVLMGVTMVFLSRVAFLCSVHLYNRYKIVLPI